MVTDISPIFGVSLMALIETATITALIASGMVAGVIYFANWRLLRQQKKVDSARLARELHSPWRNNKEFKMLLARINDPTVTAYDSIEIEGFLNRFESIATLWADGTLNDFHVKSLFSANLKTICSDDYIKARMEKLRTANPNTFSHLVKLLKESEKWGS